MAKVFQSLRGTLHRTKSNSTVSPPVQTSGRAILNDAMEELENVVIDKIGKLKAVATDSQAALADELQQAQQLVATLRENIAVLEATIRDMEDSIGKKALASQRIEESLSTKIRDLEDTVNNKDEALKNRGSEVNDLNSKIAALEEQRTQMELIIKEANDQAASEALRAKSINETSQVRIATMEAQLRNAEQTIVGKDATIKAVEEKLTAEIQELERQMRNKDELLVDRNKQVTDLKAELKRLTGVIKEMSSFFRQAQALAQVQAQDIAGEQLKTTEENPAVSHLQYTEPMSHVSATHGETVPRDTFDRLIDEIAKHTKVMTALASLVLVDHVEALGESMEKFPRSRLTELFEAVSAEISDDKLRIGFRERLAKAVNPRSEPDQ
jgi:chromosome segregation ATPase